MSRRQLLRGASVGAAGLAGAALIGCGDDDGDGTAEPSGTTSPDGTAQPSGTTAPDPGDGQFGGVLRAGQTAEINPTTGYPFVFLAENPYLTLPVEPAIRYTDSLEPELLLAERYEFNDDLTGVTITLKPGLEFHNGAPVTADDYLFGIDFLKDPAAYGVTGSFQLTSFSDSITEWKAVDDRTVEFTFDKARPNMTDFFAQLMVTERATFDQVLAGEGIQGTGPYTWDEWTPGQIVSFGRNENYHYSDVAGGPYFDGVEVKFYADSDAMGLSFEANELDLFFTDRTVASRFRDDGLTRLGPKRGLVYAGMNITSDLLGDPRVRQALFLSADRERFVNELGEGFGDVTAQPWPKESPAWRESLEAPLFEPDRARQLLEEAGFTQDRPLQIDHRTTQAYVDLASVLQENFQAIGVEVELNAMEPTAFIERLRAREFPDVWITGHSFSDLSPVTNFLQTFPYREGNMSFYEPQEYLDIIRSLESVTALSPEAQTQYDAFAELWLENPWLIPLQPTQSVMVVSDRVKGFDSFNVAPSGPPYANMWLEA